jgi:hypothetical protein
MYALIQGDHVAYCKVQLPAPVSPDNPAYTYMLKGQWFPPVVMTLHNNADSSTIKS